MSMLPMPEKHTPRVGWGTLGERMGSSNAQKQPWGGWKWLGILGDTLQAVGGGRGTYGQMLAQQQMADSEFQKRWDLAEREGQLALERDAAKAAREAKQPEIGVFEDNAGNQWRYDKRTGTIMGDQPMFTDLSPRMTAQGERTITQPNAYAPKQGQRPVGTVITDPDAAQPLGANIPSGYPVRDEKPVPMSQYQKPDPRNQATLADYLRIYKDPVLARRKFEQIGGGR